MFGNVQMWAAAQGVVADDMVGAVIFAEMVFQGCLCMGDSHFSEAGIARQFGCPGEQFEVHHVVDDYGALPSQPGAPRGDVPGLDNATQRTKAGGQRRGSLQQYGPILFILSQPIAVAEAAVEDKPDVVVVGGVLLPLDAGGKIPGEFEYLPVVRVFEQIP